MNLIDGIRSFLKQRGSAGADSVGLDESLLDQGIVDSAVMIDLISHLESTCGIQVPDEDMTPENFETLRSIAAYVDRQKPGGSS